jgi:NADP-dependent 3-hydroxy acid dehydrogenase YdfG
MQTLRDKVIIITGAGGAIAGPVEQAFADAGARPLLVDRDVVRIQGRASSYSTPPVVSDISTLAKAQEMVESAKEFHGVVDGLIHLVGDVVSGKVIDLDEDAYDRAFDTNIRTLYYATKAVLPELLKREEGLIAGIASQEAWGGGAGGASLFAASKSAVATFLRSLDQELEHSGIEVAIAFPMGPVDTLNTRRVPGTDPHTLINPKVIADALVTAALSGVGGRLLELPIHPPRSR